MDLALIFNRLRISKKREFLFNCHVYFFSLIQNGDVVEDQWSAQAKNLLFTFVKKINLPIRFVLNIRVRDFNRK